MSATDDVGARIREWMAAEQITAEPRPEAVLAALGRVMHSDPVASHYSDADRAMSEDAVSMIARFAAKVVRLHAELRLIDDLTPTCPTCDGRGAATDLDCKCDVETHDHSYPCPDCDGMGKVPVEWLIAVFNAVWDDAHYAELRGSERAMHAYLRRVRP